LSVEDFQEIRLSAPRKPADLTKAPAGKCQNHPRLSKQAVSGQTLFTGCDLGVSGESRRLALGSPTFLFGARLMFFLRNPQADGEPINRAMFSG